MGNDYVITDPPGASRQELDNWQVIRQIINGLNAQDAPTSFLTSAPEGGVSGASAHEELIDMPSKENEDHDDRYLIHIGDDPPADPVIGKQWLNTSVVARTLTQAQMLIRGFLRC